MSALELVGDLRVVLGVSPEMGVPLLGEGVHLAFECLEFVDLGAEEVVVDVLAAADVVIGVVIAEERFASTGFRDFAHVFVVDLVEALHYRAVVNFAIISDLGSCVEDEEGGAGVIFVVECFECVGEFLAGEAMVVVGDVSVLGHGGERVSVRFVSATV